MLEILKQRLLDWSQQKADTFHNNLVRDEREGKYIWEHTDTGIYLTRNGSSHFLGFDGVIYKLTDKFRIHDYEMHCRLLDKCVKHNIRVDIPIIHEFIEIPYNSTVVGTTLLYTVVKRPNNELGEDYLIDVLENRVNTDYLLEYIEQTHDIINVIKPLMSYSDNLAPACRFTVFHRNRDSLGYFWYDIKKWFMPYNQFIDMHFTDLDTILNYLKLHNIDIDIQYIKNYAVKLWAQN